MVFATHRKDHKATAGENFISQEGGSLTEDKQTLSLEGLKPTDHVHSEGFYDSTLPLLY